MSEVFPVLRYFQSKKMTGKEMLRQLGEELKIKVREEMQRQQQDKLMKQGSVGGKILASMQMAMSAKKLDFKSKLLAKMNYKSQKFASKIHSSADPIKELGIGISTYHQLLIMLFCLFFLICLMHIPVIRTFSKYHFYKNNDNAGLYAQTSLGNMGFSRTDCQSSTLIEGSHQLLDCPTGTINKLVDWGIMTRFEDHF